MSYWTHILGTIKVSPMGRTQAEKRYILETVLAHLPNVTGSESDMIVKVIESNGSESSSSSDEFQMRTDNLIDRYGQRNRERGWLRIKENYLLIVEGNLRDREFEQTYREFQKWLCRLAKRVSVQQVLVDITGYDKHEVIIDRYGAYHAMEEWPSWANKTGEPAWAEYLMWDRYNDWSIPLAHVVKYYNYSEADKEWKKRNE